MYLVVMPKANIHLSLQGLIHSVLPKGLPTQAALDRNERLAGN